MRRTVLFIVLTAFGCGGCARPAVDRAHDTARLPPHNLAGCYALFDEAGRPASKSLYYASDRVRLDTLAWGRPGTWEITRLGADGGMPADGRQGGSVYWAVDSFAADTIRIHIHTGFSGSELILGYGLSRIRCSAARWSIGTWAPARTTRAA